MENDIVVFFYDMKSWRRIIQDILMLDTLVKDRCLMPLITWQSQHAYMGSSIHCHYLVADRFVLQTGLVQNHFQLPTIEVGHTKRFHQACIFACFQSLSEWSRQNGVTNRQIIFLLLRSTKSIRVMDLWCCYKETIHDELHQPKYSSGGLIPRNGRSILSNGHAG